MTTGGWRKCQQNALLDDVNEDSKVNVSDVTALVNIILGVK